MRSFRVYNRVRRVGVTWRMGGIEFGFASMSILIALLVSIIAIGIAAAAIAGAPAAITVIAVGGVFFLVMLVVISRLVGMGRLSERTQLRLVRDAMRERRFKNFATPDNPVDVNDLSTLFADASTKYRNF